MIKPYRKIHRRGRVTERTQFEYAGPDLPKTVEGVRQLNLVPPQMRRLERRVGIKRAKRIWKVMQEVQVITIPEAIAYAWLEDRQRRFDFQSSMLGGLRVRGGAVVDFIIYDLTHAGIYIWRVQGEHWHQGARKTMQDRIQKDRLMGLRIRGLPVVAVVDLWEDDLYDLWPDVLEYAEMGIEVRYA